MGSFSQLKRRLNESNASRALVRCAEPGFARDISYLTQEKIILVSACWSRDHLREPDPPQTSKQPHRTAGKKITRGGFLTVFVSGVFATFISPPGEVLEHARTRYNQDSSMVSPGLRTLACWEEEIQISKLRQTFFGCVFVFAISLHFSYL